MHWPILCDLPGIERRREKEKAIARGWPCEAAVLQLHANGSIDDDQLTWAAEIAHAAESIDRGVDVRTTSLKFRVNGGGSYVTVDQRLGAVRLHMTYTR